MDNDAAPTSPVQRFMQWATKPPQSYAVYLVCLILIFTVSFYAGSLKPKHVPGPGPAPAAAPSAPRS